MSEFTFTPAEVAGWRSDSGFMVRAASAFIGERITAADLELCSRYAAGGPPPPAEVVRAVQR